MEPSRRAVPKMPRCRANAQKGTVEEANQVLLEENCAFHQITFQETEETEGGPPPR